jgi:hypothetical protein
MVSGETPSGIRGIKYSVRVMKRRATSPNADVAAVWNPRVSSPRALRS